MLNGDVLTDIDVTAQLAQHEATGATRHARAGAVDDPSAYGLVLLDDDHAVTRLPREAGPADCGIDSNLISRRRLRARARGPRPRSRPIATCSIEREVWPRLVGDGLYGCARRGATGWTSGRPSATCRARSTSSRATCAPGSRERLGNGYLAVDDDVRVDGPRSCRRRVVERGVRDRRGRARRQPRRARARRDGRRRRARRARGRARRARRSARAASSRDCIVGAGRPASATARGVSGGAVLGEGVTRRGGQRARARRSVFPGDGAARRSDQVLKAEAARQHDAPRHRELDRESDRAHRSHRPARPTCWRIPEHLRDALWKVESAIMQDWDAPAGLVVAGMGGSAIGGALARAALGDQRHAPDLRRARLRPAAVDDARHDRAVRELLGQHRGDARLLRGRRRARARRASWPRPAGALAELARADGVPVIPVAGGFQPRAAVPT